MKNLSATKMILVLLISIGLNLGVFAQNYSGGQGTVSDPYKIATLEDLGYLSEHNSDWGKHFIQTKGIMAFATSFWSWGAGFKPIGNEAKPFTGSYNGQENLIMGLTVNMNSSYNTHDIIGLFGFISNATIQSVHLELIDLKGGSSSGLVGKAFNSTIQNSYSTGFIRDFTNFGGGICGETISSQIINCYSTASVSSNCRTEGSNTSGGLAGLSHTSYITNSYSTGSISGRTAGGFVGSCQGSTLTNSYSTGNVSGTGSVKGFLGEMVLSTSKCCYWNKETSGQNVSAGAVGLSDDLMKRFSTFNKNRWDFMDETKNGTEDIWGINPAVNGGYPFLKYSRYFNKAIEMNVTRNTISVPNGGTCSMGSVYLQSSFSTVTFTIKNEGIHSLTLNGSPNKISISGQNANSFVVDETATSSSVSGFGYTTFKIKFTGIGLCYATVSISNNDNNRNPYTFTIIGTGMSNYSGGNGTSSNPYMIATYQDLTSLTNTPAHWSSSTYFIQTANIDALPSTTTKSGFLPIGNNLKPFSASYNGNGYSIRNLYINLASDNVGLFGKAQNAKLQNVHVTNTRIKGVHFVGGLVGTQSGGSIKNCSSTGSTTGETYIGGMVGYLNASNVNACYSSSSSFATSVAGGLIGGSDANSSVNNSYSVGLANAISISGGLIGTITNSTVNNCYSVAHVTGKTNLGGLVAVNASGSVNNSFWNADIFGQKNSAGEIGKTTEEMQTYTTFIQANWDFMNEVEKGTNDYWGINSTDNNGYPFLKWQGFTHENQTTATASNISRKSAKTSTTDIKTTELINGQLFEATIYPNPVVNAPVSLRLTNTLSNETANLMVFDANGKLFISDKITCSEANTEFVIPTTSWAKGIYFVQIKKGNELISKKLMVE